MNIFHSILCMLLIQVCERRPGVPGPPIPRLLGTFFKFFFFFHPTDRPNIRKRIRRLTKEKKGMA